MQLFIDNLTVIDCSYLHPQHGIEGESWIVDVQLGGALDAQSMIMDFALVKKRIKQAIDDWTDHCLLVPKQATELQALEERDGGVYLEWKDAQGREWKHQSPAEALCVIEAEAITAEAVRDYLQQRLPEVTHTNVNEIKLTLRHEALATPHYHYSHGLKKHDGNCQRIAHGHRSKLDIWRNGELAEGEVAKWCEKWAHIYLISEEDIIARDEQVIESAYEAPQGRFWLSAPANACDVLPEDSTVECIAQHIARQLKARDSEAQWCVKAYEGVQKGAIVSL